MMVLKEWSVLQLVVVARTRKYWISSWLKIYSTIIVGFCCKIKFHVWAPDPGAKINKVLVKFSSLWIPRWIECFCEDRLKLHLFLYFLCSNTWLLKLYKNNSSFFVYLDEHAPFWVIFDMVYQLLVLCHNRFMCGNDRMFASHFYLFLNVTLIPL